VYAERADRQLASRGVAQIRRSHAGAALGTKYEALIEQVGDAVGHENLFKNWIMRAHLSDERDDGSGSRFLCANPGKRGGPSKPGKLLDDKDHPRIEFAFPVKNVHVELLDLGAADDAGAEERLLWDANYATDERIKQLTGRMPSQGGEMPRMRQLCPTANTPWRMELRVTADDARSAASQSLEGTDRGIDETIQFEARLLHEGNPKLLRKAQHKQQVGVRREQPDLSPIPDGLYLESRAPCGPWEAVLLGRWPQQRRHPTHQRHHANQAFL